MVSSRTYSYAQDSPLLSLRGIQVNMNHARVLDRINLDIYPSEFHALVGDHAAGKTTLAKIIAGILKPTSGEIRFKNKSYSFLRIREALKLNIEMVCQDIQLINHFTVAENLFMPNGFYSRFGVFGKRNIVQETEIFLTSLGLSLDPQKLVYSMSLSDQILIYLLRGILKKPDLLILDAVLEKLTSNHLEIVEGLLKQLNKEGTSILCITHNIDEIFNLADKVTIIRNGEIILTDSINNIDKINLIKLCYTQITGTSSVDNYREFYQLLRYNEAILRKLPINLIVTDNDNRIKLINDHGRDYFGLDKDAFRDLFLDSLLSSKNEEFLATIKQSFADKKEITLYNIPLIVGNNKNVTNVKIFPIYDGAFLIGNIIIIEDITKQEQLRQQVILSEKLASVGILAAGVAHEINNPLEIIYNHLNYLKYNQDKSKITETINDIEQEIFDLKKIVSNLISFSDNKKITEEEFELNGLIGSIINLIRFNAREKKIKVVFRPAANPIILEANSNEIKQVILNLFKNSFESMEESGSIFIDTKSIGTDGAMVARIIFEDNGVGIKDDNPNNVFLPFYSTKTGIEENLGLGLSVSYGIIKKCKGSISVENLKVSGCRFTIDLPQKLTSWEKKAQIRGHETYSTD